MTQERYLDYHANRSTELLNSKTLLQQGEFVARGFDVSKGTGAWDLTIGSGAVSVDGVCVQETGALEDEVTLETASTDNPRYDTIVIRYEYDTTEPAPSATYTYIKGTPADNPTPPTVGSDDVKLADVYIPEDSTEIQSGNITNVRSWVDVKEGLIDLEGIVGYGEKNDRPRAWRYPGYIYLATDTRLTYYSDGSTWHTWTAKWGSGVSDDRPTAGEQGRVYLLLDGGGDVQAIQWDDGTEWKNCSLGSGDYAQSPHGNEAHNPNFLSVEDTHGNANHNPNFAEDPHGNEAHDPNFSEDGHTHTLGELSNVTASGEGDGGGFDADLLDGHHYNELQPAGSYASDPHDNAAHSETYITGVDLTEQFYAGQLGQITATSDLIYPVETETAYTVDRIVLRARVAPDDDVRAKVTVDGTDLETVTLPSGNNRVESTSSQDETIDARSLLEFELLDDNSAGRDFMIALVVNESTS